MNIKAITIQISDEDSAILDKLTELRGSYRATVAKQLLHERLQEKQWELWNRSYTNGSE